MNRQDKIKLLTDIQAGQATIDDMNPVKVVFTKPTGEMVYNGRIITENELNKLNGTVIIFKKGKRHEQTAKN